MIPKIDFRLFGVFHLPPIKRMKRWIAYIKGMLSQNYRLNYIFEEYVRDSTAITWSSLTTYNIDQEVYYKFAVYKSLKNSNLNKQPDLNTDYWQKILDIEIGTEKRARFRYNKIVFEYALNKYFQKQLTANGYVGFKQPDDDVSPTNSDIYIIGNALSYPSFISGINESQSDSSLLNTSTRYSTYDEDFSTLYVYHFTIMIPTTVFASINSSANIAESIIRKFADKYVISAMIYDIQTY